MSKLPFLLKQSFNFADEVRGKELYVIMKPKRNIWFYIWAFIEAFKCIVEMDCMEYKSEEK